MKKYISPVTELVMLGGSQYVLDSLLLPQSGSAGEPAPPRFTPGKL